MLRLVHSGFQADARWDEEFEATRRGWTFELRGLRLYLERHRGSPRYAAWVRMRIDAPPGEAWRRLFGPGGLCGAGVLDRPEEGDPYSIRSATGDALHGTVLVFDPAAQFAATVDEWNRALLRVKVEQYAGQREVSLWLSAYGVPRAQVAAFEGRCEQLVRALFPEAEPLPHVSCRP